jgi:hypothetical protein
LTKARISCGSACAPGSGTTTAPIFSPIISSGNPSTAASNTAGCWTSTFSTSTQYTFSPPRQIMSLRRSTILNKAVVVDAREIACVQPPVDECLGGLIGIVPIARDDVLASDEQFADAQHRIGIDQFYLHGRRG